MSSRRTLVVLLALALAITACSDSSEPTADELTLMTHDSFALSEGVLEQFTEDTGITVNLLNSGDAGASANCVRQ